MVVIYFPCRSTTVEHRPASVHIQNFSPPFLKPRRAFFPFSTSSFFLLFPGVTGVRLRELSFQFWVWGGWGARISIPESYASFVLWYSASSDRRSPLGTVSRRPADRFLFRRRPAGSQLQSRRRASRHSCSVCRLPSCSADRWRSWSGSYWCRGCWGWLPCSTWSVLCRVCLD